MVRDVAESDYRTICAGIVEMQRAPNLREMTLVLVRTAMQLVPCDHGGYSEVDVHFGRFEFTSSEREVTEWAQQQAETCKRLLPTHPVHRFRLDNPSIRVVRLSDVIAPPDFRRTDHYQDWFRKVDAEHQIVMHMGADPRTPLPDGSLPATLGVPLNRSGSDFSSREVQALSLLQQLSLPTLRMRRTQYHLELLDAAALSPELTRSLMRLGLSQRQAEVAFWMLKGKSNTDIGTILDVGAQTVREHTIEIYKRLGIGGRLALQRVVLHSVAGSA